MTADGNLAHAIAEWLPTARWSTVQPGRMDRITVPVAAPIAQGVRLALVDMTAAARTDRYVVPVDDAGEDAAALPALARWVVATALGGAATPADGHVFVGHSTSAPTATESDTCHVTLLGTDASNTSLLVAIGARTFVVKILRRCRAGVQPTVEIGAFFQRDAPWNGTPALLGWVEHVPPGAATSAVIATVHEHIPGCTTAWDRLLALVGEGALVAERGTRTHRRLLDLVDAIGSVTGTMHRALASRPDLPPFAPERPSAATCRAVRDGLVAHAHGVLDRVREEAPHLPPDLAARLQAVADRGPMLERRILADTSDLDAWAFIRVHGDYHLGQLLVADEGETWRVMVIDFEGEPGRTLEARRAKVPAAKDVAGMCRSFDYLLRCAELAGGPAHDAAGLRLLEDRFLHAHATVARDTVWWPPHAARLLEAYRIDKAVYELDYEIGHRPTWVTVPLAAVEATCSEG